MGASTSYFLFSEIPIGSSIDLPELPRTSSPAEICFQFDPGPAPVVGDADRIHDWLTPEGQIAFSCFKSDSGYHLRFPNRTDFAISPDGSFIRGYAAGDNAIEATRHDLLAQVLPRVLCHRGQLVLHASSVSTPYGAVAFLGDTGTGKSTIAASFSLSGCAVVSDDCLVLGRAEDGPRAIPTLRGPRLWTDSAAELVDHKHLSNLPSEPSGKVSLPGYADSEKDHPITLQLMAAFLLNPHQGSCGPKSAIVEELSPAEALMSFAEHSFQLDITDRPSQEQRLELFSEVAQKVPTYRLTYQQDYSCLDEVKQHVLQHLAERA